MNQRLLVLVMVALLPACSLMPGKKAARNSNVYLLEPRLPLADEVPGCHVVTMNPPVNAPGHRGGQMLYQRKANQIERFAFSRWAASPANMLEPLLLHALKSSNRYRAVLSTPAPVTGDLRVENDGVWLIQRFAGGSSEIELRMSSRLYAPAQRRLMGTRDFQYSVTAAASTPAAGVAAAKDAVRQLLEDFSLFVAETAAELDDCTDRS